MLAVSTGHAGLSGALRTVETASTMGGHRRPPRHPVHDPGSRESDGMDYAGGWKGVEKLPRIFLRKARPLALPFERESEFNNLYESQAVAGVKNRKPGDLFIHVSSTESRL